MCKKLIYVMAFVLALGSTANAALYLWNGSAGDGIWDTPANWTVTDSAWTWPNEEAVTAAIADPNAPVKNINSDTLGIDILNGDAVSRDGELSIQGAADGSTTAVLTLNASSLTVTGRLAVGGVDGTKGQIDILGGSTLTILGEGEDLRLIDNDNTWAAVNIVDSTVDIIDDLHIDQVGEAYVNISGNSTLNCDDFAISNNDASVSFVDISGTTTVTIVDDFDLDNGQSTVTIGGDAVITFGDDCYVPDDANAVATLTITDNAVFNVGDDLRVGDNEGSVGHLIVSGNAMIVDVDDFETNHGEAHITITDNASVSFSADGDLELANQPTGVATMDISGTATVNIDDDIDLGKKGVATLNISGDATLYVPDELYIGDDEGSQGHLNISGNATVTVDDDIDVGDNGPGTLDVSENATVNVMDSIKISENGGDGHMTVSGNATVNVDDDIEPGCSPGIGTLDISENATVNLGDDFELGVDAGGEGHLTVSGNASVTCDDLFVGKDLDSITSLTINGGETICGDDLHMGDSGGADIGQSRIFVNGGLLQAEGLDIKITDSQIVYTGGLFGIGSADVNEAGMQQLITDGTIVVDVVDGVYSIATTGDGYTVLNPWAASLPKIPKPADGAEGVLLGTTLSWGAGDTAATHDVYFGTTSPPALIGNQEAAAYYPGPIELGTTYYWQVVEVEADGTTKHASDVWSFTTTTDLSTVSEIATQPDLADGTDGVSIEGTTLSWWPGASAVSHDVYFGTSSPPALAGNQVELSFDSGGLKPSTTYYWQVDAVEADGTTKHTGDIWSFTTESGNAMEPDPADGATDIPKMVTLSWMPGLTAASHDVYFGDSIPPAFIGNQTETSYSPATLVKGKTYYWQIDAVEADGTTKYTGDVWSFTVTTAGR